MRAAVLVPSADGGTMVIQDLPAPAPGAGQVRVRVRATALNRGELLRRAATLAAAGSAPPQPGGTEFAGEVEQLGEGVSGWTTGVRVMGRGRGSYAEFVVVDQRELMPVPERLGWVEAAAFPNVFVTAHDALVTNARLQAGESVLVNAASSGVGTAALQIAKLLGASPVIGSSTSPAKLDRLKPLGMEVGIVAGVDDLVARVMEATGGRGVNVIIDNVGGTVLAENLRSLALEGRLVSVGRTATQTAEINLDYLALRRLRLIGVTFRTRTPEEAIACSQRAARDLLPALNDGRLAPVVDRSFPLEEVAAAQAYMLTNAHTGKIVLTV